MISSSDEPARHAAVSRVRSLPSLRSRRGAAFGAVGVATLAAGAVVAVPAVSQARPLVATTRLASPDGTRLGTVEFSVYRDKTMVRAHFDVPGDFIAEGFHGFHIHANDKPENGVGCVADPSAASSTWFVSADGHLSDVGATHGHHNGDMPSVLVNKDGSADLAFTTGRLSVGDLENRVVILHAKADNFGNVPVGTGPDDYTANSPTGPTKTAGTGNAGDRVGCGVIRIKDRGRSK